MAPNIDLACWTEENVDFRFFAKMAAKTTSGSNSECRFRLFAHGFLIWDAFLDLYLQVLASLSN